MEGQLRGHSALGHRLFLSPSLIAKSAVPFSYGFIICVSPKPPIDSARAHPPGLRWTMASSRLAVTAAITRARGGWGAVHSPRGRPAQGAQWALLLPPFPFAHIFASRRKPAPASSSSQSAQIPPNQHIHRLALPHHRRLRHHRPPIVVVGEAHR